MGELVIVGFLCIANVISSGFAANPSTTIITDHTIVAANLVAAEQKGAPGTNDPKIISMRTMNSTVSNSFFPGYCTYGAALISPEFFPYIDANTQQRTRGGNAKDRCANAQATGYIIGLTPVEGALIVYDKIGNSTAFGHVGKVIYYNSSKKTLIVRDMDRVSKFTMTDRRDTADNTDIECYIYNKKSSTALVINTTPTVTTTTTPISPTTGTLIATNTNNPQVIATIIPPTTTTTTDTTTNNNQTTANTAPVQTQSASIEVQNLASQQTTITSTPTVLPTVQQLTTQGIDLNFDNISDLAKHFLTQRNLEAKLTTNTLKVGDTAMLTITIKDPNTQTGFEGLLNVPFELIASNDNIQTNYSLIQLIKDGKIDITLTAENKGETTLLINFDGETIGKINLTIQ